MLLGKNSLKRILKNKIQKQKKLKKLSKKFIKFSELTWKFISEKDILRVFLIFKSTNLKNDFKEHLRVSKIQTS